jgi:hypothetical protein
MSFLRKQESISFLNYWTPAFAGVTNWELLEVPLSLNFFSEGNANYTWEQRLYCSYIALNTPRLLKINKTFLILKNQPSSGVKEPTFSNFL